MKENIEERLLPRGISLSPVFILNRAIECGKKYGRETFERNRHFKKFREVWATAAFILGIQSKTGIEYWIEPEYNEETPDTKVYYFGPHPKGGDEMLVLDIEVTEWGIHSRESLVEAVLRKLGNKAYSKDSHLLVHVRRASALDFEKISSEILASAKNISVANIWLLCSVAGDKADHVAAKIFPELELIRYNLQEEYDRGQGRQAPAVIPFRGTGESFVKGGHDFSLPEIKE